ncbi:MAG TPA: hypothetical protein VNM92_06970 [Thermoanaerobaculia bacterium]|nr:hypothetical protein [Thermoanaerobaculia bacterium]
MRAIGFSTGALAKGDFRSALQMNHDSSLGADAIELSALRDRELATLIDAVPTLGLSAFQYVSFHAPGRLENLSEKAVVDALSLLPSKWPLVVHPELLATPELWRPLGERLCIENMDNRKSFGRTLDEMRELFDSFPDATFCLDVGHARQVDPSMDGTLAMLRELGPRLKQLHVSDVGSDGEHMRLGTSAATAFAEIALHVPLGCPIIIESVITSVSGMAAELDAVARAFGRSA